MIELDPPVPCVTEHTWVNGSIYLDIPWAIITEVAIGIGSTSPMQLPYFANLGISSLNRTGSRLIEVSHCVKEESCSKCGSIFLGEYIPSFWGMEELPAEHIICEQETEGNQVKVTQLNNVAELLQPCTLRLWGKCKYQVEHLSFKKKCLSSDSFFIIFRALPMPMQVVKQLPP